VDHVSIETLKFNLSFSIRGTDSDGTRDLDFWLQLVGVRDLRSVIVDNVWNRDRQESEVSLAKGKAALEQLVEWFLS
jgi:hypothetical protein